MRFPIATSTSLDRISKSTRYLIPSSLHAIGPANTFLNRFTRTAAMSSTTRGTENDSSQTPKHESADETGQKQPLPLPEPPSSDDLTHQIDLSGGSGTVKLDHLGPLVVNTNGSLSRVENWAQMSELERTNTLRVLGKRNQVRLKALREKQGEEAK